jgi:hypothetical protein
MQPQQCALHVVRWPAAATSSAVFQGWQRPSAAVLPPLGMAALGGRPPTWCCMKMWPGDVFGCSWVQCAICAHSVMHWLRSHRCVHLLLLDLLPYSWPSCLVACYSGSRA